MARNEATVSVRIEVSNYDEILRLYHALGNLLMAIGRPAPDHTNSAEEKR